jgi:hypothetical protein
MRHLTTAVGHEVRWQVVERHRRGIWQTLSPSGRSSSAIASRRRRTLGGQLLHPIGGTSGRFTRLLVRQRETLVCGVGKSGRNDHHGARRHELADDCASNDLALPAGEIDREAGGSWRARRREESAGEGQDLEAAVQRDDGAGWGGGLAQRDVGDDAAPGEHGHPALVAAGERGHGLHDVGAAGDLKHMRPQRVGALPRDDDRGLGLVLGALWPPARAPPRPRRLGVRGGRVLSRAGRRGVLRGARGVVVVVAAAAVRRRRGRLAGAHIVAAGRELSEVVADVHTAHGPRPPRHPLTSSLLLPSLPDHSLPFLLGRCPFLICSSPLSVASQGAAPNK